MPNAASLLLTERHAFSVFSQPLSHAFQAFKKSTMLMFFFPCSINKNTQADKHFTASSPSAAVLKSGVYHLRTGERVRTDVLHED